MPTLAGMIQEKEPQEKPTTLAGMIQARSPASIPAPEPTDSWDYLANAGGEVSKIMPNVFMQDKWDNLISTVEDPQGFQDNFVAASYLSSVTRANPKFAYDARDQLSRALFKKQMKPSQVVGQALKNEDMIERYVKATNTLEPGKPQGILGSLKQFIREKTGLFEPPIYGQDFRETQPAKTLGRLAAHQTASYLSGLGLNIPDILTNKISGHEGLAQAVDAVTGFKPTPRDISASESTQFFAGLHTAAGVSKVLLGRVAARQALKTMLGAGLTFSTRRAAEEVADKIISNDPIDIKGIHLEGGIGVLFGAGEVGIERLASFIRGVMSPKALALYKPTKGVRMTPKEHARWARQQAMDEIRTAQKAGGKEWERVRAKYMGLDPKPTSKPSSPVKDVGKRPLTTPVPTEAPGAITTPAQAKRSLRVAAAQGGLTEEMVKGLEEQVAVKEAEATKKASEVTKAAQAPSKAITPEEGAVGGVGDTGATVVRYTDKKGRGLLNSQAYDLDKLNDDEAQELSELLNYGLQQPSEVPPNAVFVFTKEGEEKNQRLLELLSKASRNGVVRTEHAVSGDAIWQTEDGQAAYTAEQLTTPEEGAVGGVGEKVTFYRGTVPGETKRIDEPFEAAKGKLFVSRKRASARNYGEDIEEITAKPGAKILYEGDAAFGQIAGIADYDMELDILNQTAEGQTRIDIVNTAVRNSEMAGYDAVSFKADSDIGTVILNEDAFTRASAPTAGVGEKTIESEYSTTLDNLKEEMGDKAYFDDRLTALREKEPQEVRDKYRSQYPEGPAILYKPGSDRGAMIAPSAQTPGKYQVTWFDERGLSGHIEAKTEVEAFGEAYKEGYSVPGPVRGAKQMASKKFVEGVKHVEKVQKEHREAMADITKKRAGDKKIRKSELGKTTKFIKNHPIYKAQLEGLEAEAFSGAGEVRVYVPKEYNSDVEAYAGQKDRKRGMWSMITNDPQKGMAWDTFAQERGWPGDFDQVMQKLKQIFEGRTRGSINEKAWEGAIASKDVELETVALKRNLLEQDEDIDVINESIRDYVKQVGEWENIDSASQQAIIDTHTIKGPKDVQKVKRDSQRVAEKAPESGRQASPRADTTLFGKTEFQPSTGKTQGKLGLEFTATDEAVSIKPELAKAIGAKVQSAKTDKEVAVWGKDLKKFHLDFFFDQQDLFNNPSNPMPELKEAWKLATKGGRLDLGDFKADPTMEEETTEPGGFVRIGKGEKPTVKKPWLTEDKVESPDTDIEDLFQRTYTMPVQAKFGNLIELIRQGLRERFVPRHHLPSTPAAAVAHDLVRTMPEERRAAGEQAIKEIEVLVYGDGSVQALDRAGLDLLRRKVFVQDLMREAEMDRSNAGDIKAEKWKAEDARLDTLIQQVPSVKKAHQARQALWNRVSKDLYDRGVINAEARDNQAYVRHFVLTHAKVAGMSSKKKRLGEPYRGYGKERTGSKSDISTHYLAVEITALTEIYRDNAVEDVANEIAKHYGERPKYKALAKARNFSRLVGGPRVVGRIEALKGMIAESREMGGNDSGERQQRKVWIEELTELDPTYPYRIRIATHMSKLRKALGLEDEHLDEWGMSEDLSFAEMNEIIRNQPKSEEAMHARAVFKAISEREQMIKDALGRDYMTAEQEAQADSYVEWHYKRPNIVYMANTLPEFQMAAMLENVSEEAGDVLHIPKSAIRQALVMGGKRQGFLIPEWLATQLDDLPVNQRSGLVVASFTKPFVQMLKRWYLRFNPFRYNARNELGDAERLNAAGQTAAVKKIPQAVQLLMEKKGDLYQKMKQYGVAGSSLWHEMNDPSTMREFERFANMGKQENFAAAVNVFKAPLRLVQGVGNIEQALTQFREDILRVAVFLHNLEKIEKGQTLRHWAGDLASVKELVNAGYKYRAAAKISRETMVDYGDFTPWENDVLRNGWIPFYSWMKKNALFWPRTFKNAALEGDVGTTAKSAARTAAVNIPAWLIRVLGGYILVHMWNNRNEDERAKEESIDFWARTQPHINIGDRTYWGDTALNDFTEWFGMEEVAGVNWRREAGFLDAREAAIEAAKVIAQAPVNKVYQALTPLIKQPAVAITGVETFPNVFRPRIMAKAASMKSLEKAMLGLMGADAAKFYQTGKGDRKMEDTLSAYFAGWWTRPIDADTFVRRLEQTKEWVALKERSKTTGRRRGQAKAGREAEWQEMKILEQAVKSRADYDPTAASASRREVRREIKRKKRQRE